MKREVLKEWGQRDIDAFGEIEEIEAELERRGYEVEIARRLLDKRPDDAGRETWQTQVDVLETRFQQAERHREEREREMDVCDAMVAEMQADLGIDPMEAMGGIGDGEIPF